jgi:hypothetical protein
MGWAPTESLTWVRYTSLLHSVQTERIWGPTTLQLHGYRESFPKESNGRGVKQNSVLRSLPHMRTGTTLRSPTRSLFWKWSRYFLFFLNVFFQFHALCSHWHLWWQNISSLDLLRWGRFSSFFFTAKKKAILDTPIPPLQVSKFHVWCHYVFFL